MPPRSVIWWRRENATPGISSWRRSASRTGARGEPSAGVIGSDVLGELPGRGPDSTKFSSGQVLVAGGSRGLTGAPCMSALAATRAGAGYATVAVPAELEAIFEIKLTEVMSVGCPSADGHFTAAAAEPILEAAERAAAVVLGPGLGRDRVDRRARRGARGDDRGAAGDRRRRAERARRPPRSARIARGADSAHAARGGAGAPAGARFSRDRGPPCRERPGGGRRRRAPSSSSRATTR